MTVCAALIAITPTALGMQPIQCNAWETVHQHAYAHLPTRYDKRKAGLMLIQKFRTEQTSSKNSPPPRTAPCVSSLPIA